MKISYFSIKTKASSIKKRILTFNDKQQKRDYNTSWILKALETLSPPTPVRVSLPQNIVCGLKDLFQGLEF